MQLCFVFILEVIPVLLAIALITLVERRAMGSIQRRRGPNVHGALGLLQPIADGVKLILKELFATTSANTVIFMSAPLFTLFLMLIL